MLIFLLGPFSGVSWTVVTLVSAFALILGFTAPGNSRFSSPIYIAIIGSPVIFFFASGGYALCVQRIMTPRNLILLALLSYTSSCMVTAISIGFLNGIRGKTGFFFRPPKSGLERVGDNKYFRDVQLDRIAIAEAIFVTLALVLSILIAFQGVSFLALSLAGFGALTLESMNPSLMLRSNRFGAQIGKSLLTVPLGNSSSQTA